MRWKTRLITFGISFVAIFIIFNILTLISIANNKDNWCGTIGGECPNPPSDYMWSNYVKTLPYSPLPPLFFSLIVTLIIDIIIFLKSSKSAP